MKVAVTLTTINIPEVVRIIAEGYTGDNELFFVVANDVNGKPELETYLEKIENDTGKTVKYIHPNDLSSVASFEKSVSHIPSKSFAQRNYADLIAYDYGAKVIIRIDDDNFPIDVNQFIDGHVERIGKHSSIVNVSSENGFFNCCDMLADENEIRFYPRGFPVKPRHQITEVTTNIVNDITVGVNAGLWLGDPDIDAHQRLSHPINAIKFSKNYENDLVLEQSTWCPINTQNTSYSADLLPLMFVSPFAGRYDDIISGYLMRCVLDKHSIFVAYGNPLVRQDRNIHNIVNDLKNELNGLTIIDKLLIECREAIAQIERNDSLASTYIEFCQVLKTKQLFADSDFFKVILQGSEDWCLDFLKVYC